MLKFKRLASLCDDPSVIIDALAAAADKSGLMEVDTAGSKIRRAPSKPVPEWNDERKAQLTKQTVYVKGFDKVRLFKFKFSLLLSPQRAQINREDR